MGKGLAGLIGSGIGFTSEVIHAARHHNKDSISASPSASTSETPRSIPDAERESSDYVAAGNQKADADTSESQKELPIREGHAELGNERELSTRGSELPTQEGLLPYSPGSKRQSKAAEAGYSSDVGEKSRSHHSETGNDSDDASVDTTNDQEPSIDGDEAAWQLDEATEEFRLPTYDQSESKPGIEGAQRGLETGAENNTEEISMEDSEDEQAKKRERMIHALVAMAGPPPAQPQRLPCPVIIPQRRPGAKRRGFVRAYAPVLADCGISQDVFLKFINDFHKASQVGDHSFLSLPLLFQSWDFIYLLAVIIGINVAPGHRCRSQHHWLLPFINSRVDRRGYPNCSRYSTAIPNPSPYQHLP
jgi:hypothetical protein